MSTLSEPQSLTLMPRLSQHFQCHDILQNIGLLSIRIIQKKRVGSLVEYRRSYSLLDQEQLDFQTCVPPNIRQRLVLCINLSSHEWSISLPDHHFSEEFFRFPTDCPTLQFSRFYATTHHFITSLESFILSLFSTSIEFSSTSTYYQDTALPN